MKHTVLEHSGPHPHVGGCLGCYQERRCNVCGDPTDAGTGRCTNGRCRACHAAICRPGISHGYGDTPNEKEA